MTEAAISGPLGLLSPFLLLVVSDQLHTNGMSCLPPALVPATPSP